MAKPAKYTIRRTARFDQETDQLLIQKALVMGLKPAETIRVIVEHSLKGQPIVQDAS